MGKVCDLTSSPTVVDRSHDEMCDLAAKVLELSQALRQKWLKADYATKRRILEIVFLNCRLDDVTLVPTIRKPFDVLAEGHLVQSSRGDRTAIELISVALRAWQALLFGILKDLTAADNSFTSLV